MTRASIKPSAVQAVDNGAGGSVTKATSYGLDPTGRINTITNTTAGTETNRLRYRFPGSSDSPSRIDTSSDAGSTWASTRYLQLPGLGMAGAVSNSTATLQLANLHGDIVATQTNTTSTTTVNYTEADEYGNTITGNPGRYGWLGTHQRTNDSIAGLRIMGVRLYNPSTGLFSSADPLLDGGANRYSYPTDPINQLDLTGEYWWGGYHKYSGHFGFGYYRIWLNKHFLRYVARRGMKCGELMGAVIAIFAAVPGVNAVGVAVAGAIAGLLWFGGYVIRDSLRQNICVGYRYNYGPLGVFLGGYAYESTYACGVGG